MIQGVKLLPAMTILLIMVACDVKPGADSNSSSVTGGLNSSGINASTGRMALGLEKYGDDVADGLPVQTDLKLKLKLKGFPAGGWISNDGTYSMGDMSISVWKLLVSTNEPGNLVREMLYFDSLISEINSVINISNQSDSPSYTVTSNASGSVTLPFFGSVAPVDFIVENTWSGGSKYIGYQLNTNQGVQSVVVFYTSSYGGMVEYNLYSGYKSNDQVTIQCALLAENESTGDFDKAWAYTITVESNQFSFQQAGAGMMSTTLFQGAHSMIGKADGYFLVREREDTNALANIDCTEIWQFDSATGIYSSATNVEGITNYVGYTTHNYQLVGMDELTKPAAVTAEEWTNGINFVNEIAWPMATNNYSPYPDSTNTFNNSFLKD